MTEGPATVENRTFGEIAIGNSASVTKTLHVRIACAALATDGVKLITGDTLYVDGGLHVLG